MNAKKVVRIKNHVKREFGLTVRRIRNEASLSQEQLAERSHLHPTYIGSIERGERSVGLEKIIAIARALNISPRDLMPEK